MNFDIINPVPLASREEQKDYQRAWVANRRAEWVSEHGPCAMCVSWENLEVDHIEGSTKELNPGALWSMSPMNPRRIAELAKCQVLCHDCHVKKTWQHDRKRADHGTDARYGKYKCRCGLCKEARRVAKKANRQRRKALGLPYQ